MKNNKKLKCASFFAGIGGIDLGFLNTNHYEIVYANEYDKYAAETYNLNHKTKIDLRDIRDVKAHDIPDFDVLLAGWPCQPFSIAGKQQGFNDEKNRGTLFFELTRIIKEKNPNILFLENVKNLKTHDNGNTFKVIKNELENNLNYYVKEEILNALDYGNIPQNRERIYIVAFKNKEQCDRFSFPKKIPLTTTVHDIIDFNSKEEDVFYYTKGKYAKNLYEKLDSAIDDTESVYQWRRVYVRKNKSGVIPTLTANQGCGGHNVCIIKTKHGIRKMTPRECFNAQGFPKNYILPKQCNSRLYKQAGNSVCVNIITRIAENIYRTI